MNGDRESPRLGGGLRWAADVLGKAIADVHSLAGDVSLRRYYRLRTNGSSAILAYYPSELGDAFDRFLRSSEILSASGVRVPEILAADSESRFMLVEDVGGETIFERRGEDWEALLPLVRASISVAARIARDVRAEEVADLNPPLGAELMLRELSLTWDVFLVPNRLCGPGKISRRLRGALEALCRRLEEGGLVPCHRDFMVRNLVPAPDGGVVVLDHQDLRLGPRGYDAASLLNDSLFPPHDLVPSLLDEAGVEASSYHRSAVQRSLKAIGTFVAFARRGHRRHLPLVPACLERCLHHLRVLPETEALADELAPLWRGVC